MKCIREEIAGSDGRKRWVFAMGKNEAMLILAIVEDAKKYTPRVAETVQVHSRLRNILKGLHRAVREMSDDVPHEEEPKP